MTFHPDSMWAESARRREQFLAEAEHQRLVGLAKGSRRAVEPAASAQSLLRGLAGSLRTRLIAARALRRLPYDVSVVDG